MVSPGLRMKNEGDVQAPDDKVYEISLPLHVHIFD